MKKILVIGPSIDRTKGGMATVISSQLESNPNSHGFQLAHIVSHVEGGVLDKLMVFFKSSFQLIKTRDVSIVHMHVASDASFYRKSLLAFMCRVRKLPVIMHIHGCDFDEFYQNSNFLSKFWIRKTFRSIEKVLVLSAYWHEFFRDRISGKNVEVLHNGVNVDIFKTSYSATGDLKKFLFLGRLMQRKGVYDLLEAINIIVNVGGRKDLTFYLAGDGDLEQVTSIIQRYNLGKYVHILGWLGFKEKQEYLKEAFTVLLPSYNEGLPMALLEAMSCGKVIISSTVGGIPELVEEGENGFLVIPGDINGIVEKILYVLNNREEMEYISMNNIRKIDQNYNLQKLNTKLYKIYSEVLLP